MSILIKATGITKLSELEIDGAKDWQGQSITNLGGVATGMLKGDIAVKASAIIEKLVPGTLSYVLTSAGPGHIPGWMPGAALEVWIPAVIEMSHSEGLQTIDKTANKTLPALTTEHKQSYLDAPADLIKRLTPAITVPAATAKVSPDKTASETPAIGSEAELRVVVAGAVADDGGAQTDETTEAQEATADDMTLAPAGPAVDDAYYLMSPYKAPRFYVNITTPGVGNWALAHEYYDGVTPWKSMVDIVDETLEWTGSGICMISHTPQGDWATTTIQGHNGYWIRARFTAFNNITTQPLGGQAWYSLLV